MAGGARVRLEIVADTDEVPSLETGDLFRRYAPYVAKIGYRLLGSGDDIDDLVQDVFLAAHRGLRNLRQPEAVKGWLATVAVRVARRRLRRRRMLTVVGLNGPNDYQHEVVDPAATPEQRALVSQVYRILDRLPVNHRIAWTLRHVQGETLERVAELSGCSLATAKRRIRAAALAIEEEVPNE